MTSSLPLYLLPAFYRAVYASESGSPPPSPEPSPAPTLGGAMGLQGRDHAPASTSGGEKEATGGSNPGMRKGRAETKGDEGVGR